MENAGPRVLSSMMEICETGYHFLFCHHVMLRVEALTDQLLKAGTCITRL
jgi:ABC-type uncharacterized transport system ATPase subunit